jgi:hypothetical protein
VEEYNWKWKHTVNMVTCGNCPVVAQCLFLICGCRNMHVTHMYLCDACLRNRTFACVFCGDSICDFAVHIATEDEPFPAWYTSWEGYVHCPK